MKLKALFGLENPHEETALLLYNSIVAQARRPYFYRELKVSDTVEGRYDMIIIHAFLLFYRLKDESENAKNLGQTVFDTMFRDIDQSLREMGVGDMGVGPRIKKMASSFYGRISAYDKALEEEDNEELEQAVARNVFTKSDPDDLVLKQFGTYIRANVGHLKVMEMTGILSGKISYMNPEDTDFKS